MKFVPFFRHMSHANSSKKISDRTTDDNLEASEYTDQKFRNRKGGAHNLPDLYDDVIPSTIGKKPVKPEKGMRKFKGSKTIRKPDAPEDPNLFEDDEE